MKETWQNTYEFQHSRESSTNRASTTILLLICYSALSSSVSPFLPELFLLNYPLYHLQKVGEKKGVFFV